MAETETVTGTETATEVEVEMPQPAAGLMSHLKNSAAQKEIFICAKLMQADTAL